MSGQSGAEDTDLQQQDSQNDKVEENQRQSPVADVERIAQASSAQSVAADEEGAGAAEAGESGAAEAGESAEPAEPAKSETPVLRSKGQPRPAKVALLVWRISGNFATRVLGTLQEHTPDFASWQNRKRRLTQETLLVRIVKQVVEWEQYAETSLAWKEPFMQQHEGKLQYVQGNWELRPGRVATVADATAAMIQAVGNGGVRGDICDYTRKYIETFHKRLAIRGYTPMDAANVCLYRANLQREFFAQGSISRRFQVETKVLANELGKRRAENNKFDSYANTIALKEKFFRVQLRQSQLTAEANLASRSLYTFRQLAKLYRSVKECIDEFLDQEEEVTEGRPATPGASLFKRRFGEGDFAEYGAGFFDPNAFNASLRDRVGALPPRRVQYQMDGKASGGGPRTGQSFGGERREDQDGDSDNLHTRPSFMPSEAIGVDDKEGHLERVEELQQRRDELKVAAATMVAKSRFNQLVKLMDQGHMKLNQLSAQTKHNDEIIDGIKEAIEEEMLPVARKWVHDMARAGKLPRDMLEKVQTESLRQAGVAERDALLRKVGRMDEILEEMKVESRSEKLLRRELEDIGGTLPASAQELASQAAEAAKTAQQEMLARKSRGSMLGNKAKGYGILLQKDDEADGQGRMSMASGRQSMLSGVGGRQSVAPSRRTLGAGRGTAAASEVSTLTAAQKLDKVNALITDAQSIHPELLSAWPLQASVEGDRLLERAAALDNVSKVVGQSLNRIVNQEAFETFEEQARKWQTAGQRLIQNMETFTDALEYEQMPEAVVKQAIKEQEEQIRLGLRRKSAEGKGKKKPIAGNKRAKILQKLQEAQMKMDNQIGSQVEKNGRQKHTNEELAKLVSEAERDLAKLGIHVAKDDTGALQPELDAAGNASDSPSPTGSPKSGGKKGKKKKQQEAAASAAAGQESASGVASGGAGAASALAAGAASGGAAATDGAAASGAARGAVGEGSGAAGAAAAEGAAGKEGAAASAASAGGTAVADPVLDGDEESTQDSKEQDSRLRHVQNELAVAKLRKTNLTSTISTLEKQIANVKAGRDPDFELDRDSNESGEIEDPLGLLEGRGRRERGKDFSVSRKSKGGSEQDGKKHRDSKLSRDKNGEIRSSSKEAAEKEKNYEATLERRGKNLPRAEDGELNLAGRPEGEQPEGTGEDGLPPTPSRRLAISGPSSQSRTQRAQQMGLQMNLERKSGKGQDLSGLARGGARGSVPDGSPGGRPELQRARSEKLNNINTELEELEPWRRIFPNDPPEVAKQKYEFCRAHKVVYAHLYIHKKQRRLKFKLVRLVKQQRRHLKLKTKLLMSFLSDDQKIAMQQEVGLHPDGDAKQEAHHKAELGRLNDRLNMLGKLLAFWRRRMGAFEDEIEGKRKMFRGEIGRALEHITRMADLLRIEREYEREVLQERHREIEERRLAEMEKAQKKAKEKAEKESQNHEKHGHPHERHAHHGRSDHLNHPKSRQLHEEHHKDQVDGHKQGHDRLAHGDKDGNSKTSKDSGESASREADHHPEHQPQSRGFHRRDESGPVFSEHWKGHLRSSMVRTSHIAEMGIHLDEAIKVTKTHLEQRKSNPRSSIGMIVGNGGMSTHGGRKAQKRETLPEEDKALEFLHTLMHRLAAVNEAVTATMHVGEVAMSDTLLAPKVNGQALLKYYIGLVLQQPVKQREIVFNHLIGLERQRLILLVRQSARHPVRNAIEACNQVIKVLEMNPAELEEYVHASEREKEPTPSESSDEEDSSLFSSSSSEDDKDVKEQLKKRKRSKQRWNTETAPRLSATAKNSEVLAGASKRMSDNSKFGVTGKKTVSASSAKGALKKGSTVKHEGKEHHSFDFELKSSGAQDHESDDRPKAVSQTKSLPAAKLDGRPLTHARGSLTMGGPAEDLLITGSVKKVSGMTAKRSSIQKSRTQPELQSDSEDKSSRWTGLRSALAATGRKKDRKHMTIAFAAEVSKEEEELDKGEEDGEERTSGKRSIKFEPDIDGEEDEKSKGFVRQESSESTGSSSGLSEDEQDVTKAPGFERKNAPARQAGRPVDRRRTAGIVRRNSIGSASDVGSRSMLTPGAGLQRRLSLDSITRQNAALAEEHRKFNETLLKRKDLKAKTEHVDEEHRRALRRMSGDGGDGPLKKAFKKRSSTMALGAADLLKGGIAKILSHEADVEPMHDTAVEMDTFGAAMGEEWLKEAKAARRASLMGMECMENPSAENDSSKLPLRYREMMSQGAVQRPEETEGEPPRRKRRGTTFKRAQTLGADLLQASSGDEHAEKRHLIEELANEDHAARSSLTDFMAESARKSRRNGRGTPVPDDFHETKGRLTEVHFDVPDPSDRRGSARKHSHRYSSGGSNGSDSPTPLEKVGSEVSEQLGLLDDPAASYKRRQSIIGDMEEAMQGVYNRLDSITATASHSSRGISILRSAFERGSLAAGTEYEGSDDDAEEDEEDADGEEQKSKSMMPVLIAAKFKNLFRRRRKSFRPQDFNSILRERSKFLEACQKFNKWLRRRGNLEHEIKKSLPPMNGRPRSAFARLTHQHRGHRTRGVDNNVDFLAASFLARQLWHHRLSCLPSWTEELDAEWQAIKDAVRQTKNLRLNEQQKRVAEMLHEMESDEGSDEGSEEAEEERKKHQSIFNRASKVERTLQASKTSESVNHGVSEQVRKELARQMRKDIQKKTRTLSSEETSFTKHEAARRRMQRKTFEKSRPTAEVGNSEHRAALFKLDEELFAMMEELEAKKAEEDEKEEKAFGGMKTKSMQRMQNASQRRLRKRAVLGNQQSDQPSMVSMDGKRNLKNPAVGATAPRWNRWVTAKGSPAGMLDVMGFADVPETQDKHRPKGKTRKLKQQFERKGDAASTEGSSERREEQDIVNRKRQSVVRFSKHEPQVDRVEEEDDSDSGSEIYEASAEETDGGNEGHTKERGSWRARKHKSLQEDAEDDGISNSDESSGESWDGITDEDDLLNQAPRKDRRAGFLMQSQYLERIQTSEIAMRPLLLDHGKHLERRLGVPLNVIIETALVQDGECEAILLNMSASDFLSAMERMLLELEKRYLAEEEEEETRRGSEHLVRAANHSPGLGYAPPVDEDEDVPVPVVKKSKRRSQRRSQHNQLVVGRRSRCGSARSKRKLDASRAAPTKGKMFRRMSTERALDSIDFPVRMNSKRHPDATSTASESQSEMSVLAASQLKALRQQQQPPKQTLSATDFRLLVGRTEDWLQREAERRKRPEQLKSAKPAQGWLSRVPPAQEEQQRQESSEEQIQQLRGALHRNVERAFRRHVQMWRQWRMGGGAFTSESYISEGDESSEDQEVPTDIERQAEYHSLRPYSDVGSGHSEEWAPTHPREDTQAFAETSETVGTAEASLLDAPRSEASGGSQRHLIVGSDSGGSLPPGDETPKPDVVDSEPSPLAISTVNASNKHRPSIVGALSEAQPNDKPRGTLRRLPSMPIRPSVAPVMSSDEVFNVSNSKRLGQLEALEAQPQLPTRTASTENLHSSVPRSTANAALSSWPVAPAAPSQAASGTLEGLSRHRLSRGFTAGAMPSHASDARPQTAAAPVTAPADSMPSVVGELKPLQAPPTVRGTRPSTVSTVSPRKSVANASVKKVRPAKEPIKMDEYLENFDEVDLDVLLHDFSRPGTRLSRPGTRMSSERSRPGTRSEWERVFGGRMSREDAAPVSAESDPKLTGWQDFSWPSAPSGRRDFQLHRPANVGDQTTNLPSLESTTESPTSPGVQHSMVSSSVSTQDSWKAAFLERETSQWKAKGLPKPPGTAPGGGSTVQHARTPRLPETGTPRSAPGQSRGSRLEAERHKVEASSQKVASVCGMVETPQSSATPRSSEHALAALCHGLEKQATTSSQRNSTSRKFSDEISADMAAAAAYHNTFESQRNSGAWTSRGSGHGPRSSGSGKTSARGSRVSGSARSSGSAKFQ